MLLLLITVADLMCPPHHEVGEDSDPQNRTKEGDHEELPGFLQQRRRNVKPCSTKPPDAGGRRSFVATWFRTSGTVSHRGKMMGSRKRKVACFRLVSGHSNDRGSSSFSSSPSSSSLDSSLSSSLSSSSSSSESSDPSSPAGPSS